MPAVYLDVDLYTGRQPVAVVSAQLPAPLGNDPEGVRKRLALAIDAFRAMLEVPMDRKAGPLMPSIPKHIVIDVAAHSVLIDGLPFMYPLADDPVGVDLSHGGLPIVRLSLIAQSVEMRHELPNEGETQ